MKFEEIRLEDLNIFYLLVMKEKQVALVNKSAEGDEHE